MNEPDEKLLQRYREASDAQAVAPGEHVRAAILAEGRAAARRYAASSSESPAAAGPAPDRATARSRGHPRARRRWLYTLIGTASAAVLAGILVLPGFLKDAPLATPKAAMSAGRTVVQAEVPRKKVLQPDTSAIPATGPAPEMPARATASPATSAPAASAPAPASLSKESVKQAPEAMAADRSSAVSLQAIRHEHTSPLFDALVEDDPVKLRRALADGAAVDARDARGRTPLLLAIELGRVEMAKELLEHDANPAVTDAAGRTPLDLARQLRRADLVDLLQRAGARR